MTYDNLKPVHGHRIFMITPGIITVAHEEVIYNVDLEKKNLYPTRVRKNDLQHKVIDSRYSTTIDSRHSLHQSRNILIYSSQETGARKVYRYNFKTKETHEINIDESNLN